MKKIFFIIIFSFIFLIGVLVKADVIKGYMVPEFYYVASSENADFQGQNGFWFKRIYFGYTSELGSGWSTEVRLEMNNSAYMKNSVSPYLKNAYVKKKFGEKTSLLLGLIEPPSFNKVEKFWGLRFIEKTPADFFKFASSRDAGLAIDGKTKGGMVYTMMFGNYGSNKGEWNKGKAVYGRIGRKVGSNYLEINAHYAKDGKYDFSYASAFYGRKGKWGRIGLNYTYLIKKEESDKSKDNGILSGFIILNMGRNLEFYARYDYLLDKNFKDIGGYVPVKSSLYKARYVMSGFDYSVSKMIRFSPNIKYVFYGGENAPSGDFYFNITMKVSFNTEL